MLVLLTSLAFGLEISPSEFIQGQPATVAVRGAVPGESVRVFAGADGVGPCPAALGGLCLDVTRPRLLGTIATDASGTGTLSLTIPSGAPLVSVQLQAAHAGPSPQVSAAVSRSVLGVHAGPLVVDSQASADLLAQLAWVQGDIAISPGAPAELVAPHLRVVDGGLFVEVDDVRFEAAQLPSLAYVVSIGEGGELDMPSLVSLDMDLSFYTAQDSVNLPALTSVGWLDLPVLFDLTLPALASVGEMTMYCSASPGAPAGGLFLPELVEVTGGLTVNNCETLTDFHVPSLRTVGYDVTWESNGLAFLHLDALESVGGDITIERNSLLATLSAPALTSADRVTVQYNPMLPDCTIEAVFAAFLGDMDCGSNLADACTGSPTPYVGECDYF